MKVEMKVIQEFDIKYLFVEAKVRDWEDGEVDGVEDAEGKLIPCREGDIWKPIIEIETGQITNWQQGKTADIHYKVCDAGVYTIKGDKGLAIKRIDGYVPSILSPGGSGYGDYIIMSISDQGVINNWKCSPSIIKEEFDIDEAE